MKNERGQEHISEWFGSTVVGKKKCVERRGLEKLNTSYPQRELGWAVVQ